MGDRKRIQFELDGERNRALERLMAEVGVRTRKEFFNYALSLLKWAIEERRQGRRIASIDSENGRIKELEMPIFSSMGEKRS
mgnify:CR=1 FL=1